MSTPQSRSGAEFPGRSSSEILGRVDDAFPSTSGAMQGLEWWTGEAWSTLPLSEEPSRIHSRLKSLLQPVPSRLLAKDRARTVREQARSYESVARMNSGEVPTAAP
ncbi:hypothetical protein D9M68_793670 [compost metagenome]